MANRFDPYDPNADPQQTLQRRMAAALIGGTAQAGASQAPAVETPRVELPVDGASAAAPVTPKYGTDIGQYTGNKYFGQYDEGKFNDPTHDSPKYQALRTLSHFDPSQGITPDVLNALNSLKLGTFSGSGDKVKLTNADPRWDGMTGADLITDFGPGGKNLWGVQGEFPGAVPAQGAQLGGGSPLFGGSAISPMLQGDAQSGVLNALSALQQQPNSLIAKLIAQLQGAR